MLRMCCGSKKGLKKLNIKMLRAALDAIMQCQSIADALTLHQLTINVLSSAVEPAGSGRSPANPLLEPTWQKSLDVLLK